MGEEYHKLALQRQHQAFMMVHKNLKKAKQKQKKYADKHCEDVTFKVGDPVYLKNYKRNSKFDNKWTPYYRVIEQRTPVSFIVKNQLTGKTTKAHARHLRLADIDNWEIPAENKGRPLRKSVYVTPPDESGEDKESSNSWSSDDNIPLAKLANRWRRERENSSSEENIPLFEIKKRIRRNKMTTIDKSDVMTDSDLKISINDYDSDDEASDNQMSINTNMRDDAKINSKHLTFKSVNTDNKNNKLNQGDSIKSLVASIVGLMKQ